MLHSINEFPLEFYNYIMGAGLRIWPVYLLFTLVICFAIFAATGVRGSFLKWLFPKSVYINRSALVDIQLFIIGRLFSFFGILKAISLTTVTAAGVMMLVGGSQAKEASWHPLLIGLILVLAHDFGVYWVHRLHHETTPLWPFHAVHHSAEVMTPMTVYRKHPVYDLISSFLRGILGGVVQGILLGLFVGNLSIAGIAGVNAIYVIFNAFGANIRHTHIWLSYGRFLEHIFISPAQHQIHHSRAKRHWNKNYGEIFAFWDLIFGTLYVPNGREILEFGLADSKGDAIDQPHNTATEALLVPFAESFSVLKNQQSQQKKSNSSSLAKRRS